MDRINPIDIILGIIFKGIMLGIVIAIAWPVKALVDYLAISGYRKIKEIVRPTVEVPIKSELAH